MRPRELGSPPHTRGKAPLRITLKANLRITPAYAGKSAFSFARQSFSRDHPRIRGEKLLPLQDLLHEVDHPRIRGEKRVITWLKSCLPGSPPHTRGKVLAKTDAPACLRITPAYAGKRRRTMLRNCLRKDHPRIRGEKNLNGLVHHQPPGSPPHTGGKDHWHLGKYFWSRITPAYAGKSGS